MEKDPRHPDETYEVPILSWEWFSSLLIIIVYLVGCQLLLLANSYYGTISITKFIFGTGFAVLAAWLLGQHHLAKIAQFIAFESIVIVLALPKQYNQIEASHLKMLGCIIALCAVAILVRGKTKQGKS